MNMADRQIRVRWEGSGSVRYDGKTQDVARRYVVVEDLEGVAVGNLVRVKWGRRSRVWRGVVVDLLDEDLEQPVAMDTTTNPTKKRRREPANNESTTAKTATSEGGKSVVS